VDAFARDLGAASSVAQTVAQNDEERLAKVEKQTQVLAEAVIAMTDAAAASSRRCKR
jgi:hypothetical protein